jgi:hypothetical protein
VSESGCDVLIACVYDIHCKFESSCYFPIFLVTLHLWWFPIPCSFGFFLFFLSFQRKNF